MSYREFGLNLSATQKQKIARAVHKKEAITIRLSKDQLHGYDKMMLTEQQIKKITKHKGLGTGFDLKLSSTQLRAQNGGWIGSLLAGIAGSLLPSLLGKGLTLPGTTGRGLFLPGSHPKH